VRATLVAELGITRERINRLVADQAVLTERQSTWLAAKHEIDRVTSWLSAMRDALPTLDTNTKRLFVEALRVEVTVYRSDHSPRFTISAAIPLDSEPIQFARGTCRRRCRY
jgi:hypothetical protein